MAKSCGQDIFLLRGDSSTVTISVVADETARDALPAPADGDIAYLKSENRYDKYVTAAWVDDGADADKVALRSSNLDEAFTTVNITDNTTASGATETETLRAARALTLESVLRDGSDNKVVGNDLGFVFDSIAYGVRSFNLNEAYNEADVTDSDTSGDGDETCVTRAVRTSNIVLVAQNDQADLTLATSLATTLQFKTGLTATGNLRLESVSHTNQIDETQEQSYDGTWQGAVTQTLVKIASAEELPTLLVTGQGKTYVGDAISLGFEAAISYDAEGTVTYNLKFNGGITKTNN